MCAYVEKTQKNIRNINFVYVYTKFVYICIKTPKSTCIQLLYIHVYKVYLCV